MALKKILTVMSASLLASSMLGIVANAEVVSGAKYYITTDGSTPSATNTTAVLWDGISDIQITPPNTDETSQVTVKMVGVKDGYVDTDVITTVVSFDAIGAPKSIVNDAVITVNKSEVSNRYSSAVAFVSNLTSGADYYYTLDGSVPTSANGILLSGGYIKLPAPDTDAESQVIVTVKGYASDGGTGNAVSNAVLFDAKVVGKYTVSIKDFFNNDIAVKTVDGGTSVVSLLDTVTPPTVEGYDFTGWSIESGTVTSDMIVRAHYQVSPNDIVLNARDVQVVNKGTAGDSSILVSGRVYGEYVYVYEDSTKSVLKAKGTVDIKGQCEMTTSLPDSAGSLYVVVSKSGVTYTAPSGTSGSTSVSALAMSDFSTSGTSDKSVKVYYQESYMHNNYSDAILPSRCYFGSSDNELVVKGLHTGDIANVYDTDNNVVGTATESGGTSKILLFNAVTDSTYLYVSRTSTGLMESPQTEITKITLSENATRDSENIASANQAVADVKTQVQNILNSYEFSNSATAQSLTDFLSKVVTNPNISIDITGFNKTDSTADVSGTITGVVNIVDTADTSKNDSVNLNGGIAKLGESAQTIAQATIAVNDYLTNGTFTDSTTKQEVQDAIDKLVTNAGITATVTSFSNDGTNLSVAVSLSNGTDSNEVSKTKAVGSSSGGTSGGTETGGTTGGSTTGGSTTGGSTTGGSTTGGSTTGGSGTSTGGSSGGSSGSNSSGSGGSSASNSGSVATSGSTDGSSQSSIGNASGFVNSIGGSIGATIPSNKDGVTTNSTPVYDSSHNITGIILKSTGSSIHSSAIKSGDSDVKFNFLYKIEPVTGKCVLLADKSNLASIVFDFTSQPNTVYYASVNALDKNLVLSEGLNTINNSVFRLTGIDLDLGWKKVDNNWYYFHPTQAYRVDNNWVKDKNTWYYLGDSGKMSTNWEKYKGVWYYLNPSSGAMATSWQQVGDKWYYLNESGAMETGWRQVGSDWYYMHEDGHMASNETISGYTVNIQGVCVY